MVEEYYDEQASLLDRVRCQLDFNPDVEGTVGNRLDKLTGGALSKYKQGRWHVQQTMSPDRSKAEIAHHREQAAQLADQLPGGIGRRSAQLLRG